MSFPFAVMYNLPDDPYANSTAHGCANVAMSCPKFLNADSLTKRVKSFSKLNAIGARVSCRRCNEQVNATFGRAFAADFRTLHAVSSQSKVKIGSCALDGRKFNGLNGFKWESIVAC